MSLDVDEVGERVRSLGRLDAVPGVIKDTIDNESRVLAWIGRTRWIGQVDHRARCFHKRSVTSSDDIEDATCQRVSGQSSCVTQSSGRDLWNNGLDARWRDWWIEDVDLLRRVVWAQHKAVDSGRAFLASNYAGSGSRVQVEGGWDLHKANERRGVRLL